MLFYNEDANFLLDNNFIDYIIILFAEYIASK